jgi:hypothetical protein
LDISPQHRLLKGSRNLLSGTVITSRFKNEFK